MINLWCDGCRTVVHAVGAYHRPSDGRFPWMEYIRPEQPHLWLCLRCHNQHPDLAPYTTARRPPTAVPSHWLIYAFGVGALAGMAYILAVLLLLTL